MDNIVVTARPHQAVASLAELATQIDAAHGRVETALRDGLAHARQAGELLIQAKGQVEHGQWLPWLEKNCTVTPRAAQQYMRIAERWP